MENQTKQILILRGGAIGDFVLTLPAIGAIRRAFPSAHIHLLGHSHVAELAVGRGYADSAWRLDDPVFASLFAPMQQHPQTSLGVAHANGRLDEFRAFDLIVAFWRDPEGVLARNLGRFCAGQIVVHDPVPPTEPKRHAADHLCQVLADIGIGKRGQAPFVRSTLWVACGDKRCLTPFPRLFPTEDDLAQADAFLAENGLDPARTIAIHPGSGGRTKNWPAERFAEVAKRVISELGCRVLMTCGPADKEVADKLTELLPKCLSRGVPPPNSFGGAWAENLPLPLLAAILSKCRATLGNDSGITHIAAAVGCPTLAIFGPTDPDVWGPRGKHVAIIRGSAPCTPCTREERMACPDRKCLASMSVEQVWQALAGMLGRTRG